MVDAINYRFTDVTTLKRVCKESKHMTHTRSNRVLTAIVSVMATHGKLRYNARLVNKRYTERKESYGRIRCKSPRLNLLSVCKVNAIGPVVKWI